MHDFNSKFYFMRRFILTISFLLSLFTASFSQEAYAIKQAMDFYRTNKLQTGDWKATLSESDIEGSPYLNDEFISGTIYTTAKQKFINIPLRYNIYNDALEFKTPDNVIQAMATPEILESAEFGEYTVVYAPFSNSKKVSHGYFQVVVSGEASLYIKSNIRFNKAQEPVPYKDAIPAQFHKKPDTYFIKVGPAEAKKVNNKKDLIKIFPDHQNEISSFIKKNKTKISKQDHLKALVEYYNAL